MTIEKLNEINTTNFRILTSVVVAGLLVTLITVAVLFFAWEPTLKQERTLIGVGVVILTMMGFDVLQFVGKRFSDSSYAAAKSAGASTGSVAISRSGDATVTSEPDPKAVESAAVKQILEAADDGAVG